MHTDTKTQTHAHERTHTHTHTHAQTHKRTNAQTRGVRFHGRDIIDRLGGMGGWVVALGLDARGECGQERLLERRAFVA